jgi:hypothetical protein
MSSGYDRLPPDVKALVQTSKGRMSVPAGARSRLAARLNEAMPGLLVNAPPPGRGLGAPSFPKASPPVPSAIGGTLGGALASWAAKALLVLAVGGGTWATVRAVGRAPRAEAQAPLAVVGGQAHEAEESVPLVATVNAPAPEPDVARAVDAPLPSATARSIAKPPSAVEPPVQQTGAASLREERSLLDAARDAIVRGDPEAALAPTAAHAARFPRGVLAEERDALRIRALARLGRSEEARALLATMRADYPNSFLLPGATADVASIP